VAVGARKRCRVETSGSVFPFGGVPFCGCGHFVAEMIAFLSCG
jgi:hypothetical protein